MVVLSMMKRGDGWRGERRRRRAYFHIQKRQRVQLFYPREFSMIVCLEPKRQETLTRNYCRRTYRGLWSCRISKNHIFKFDITNNILRLITFISRSINFGFLRKEQSRSLLYGSGNILQLLDR